MTSPIHFSLVPARWANRRQNAPANTTIRIACLFTFHSLGTPADCQLRGRHRMGFANRRRVSTSLRRGGGPKTKRLCPETFSSFPNLIACETNTTGVGRDHERTSNDRRPCRTDARRARRRERDFIPLRLVVILLLIGILKFTPAEADGIQPLVAHSPLIRGCISSLANRESPISLALPNFLLHCFWHCDPFLRGRRSWELGGHRHVPAHDELPVHDAGRDPAWPRC